MKIYVHTDTTIDGSHDSTSRVQDDVGEGLARFRGYVTRVDVHLSDESAGRTTGEDVRCLIEALVDRQAPVTVTEDARSTDAAASGAVHRLTHLLVSREGRERDLNDRSSIRGHGHHE